MTHIFENTQQPGVPGPQTQVTNQPGVEVIFDTGSSDLWLRGDVFAAADSSSFVDLEAEASVVYGGRFGAGGVRWVC